LVADMRVRSVPLIRSLACASLLMFTMSAFAASVSGPVVVLPNSYYLQPDKGGQTKLVKHDGSRLLPGTIAAYTVTGQFVTGAVGVVPDSSRSFTNDLDFAGSADTRYFILDTVSGKLETDLDEATWHKRLQELGVHTEVHIYPPLPWQN
jgi:hypothetical protein